MVRNLWLIDKNFKPINLDTDFNMSLIDRSHLWLAQCQIIIDGNICLNNTPTPLCLQTSNSFHKNVGNQ